MNPPVNYTPNREFSARIDDLSVRLLIDDPDISKKRNENKSLYHIMHDHATGELFVCAEGEIYIRFQSGTVKLSEGEAAIVPKGMLHTNSPDTTHSVWYAISFLCTRISSDTTYELYKDIAPIVDTENVIVFKNADNIRRAVEKILGLSRNAAHTIMPALRMAELLIECSQMPHETFEDSAVEGDSSESDIDLQRIAKLDQLVYTNYMNGMTSEDIAAQLFISSRQLDRIARKRYGRPIHKVIMDRRITAAENMLLSTDMTSDSIGATVGFGSRSGFYREFNRRHGMTPNQYRQQNKK